MSDPKHPAVHSGHEAPTAHPAAKAKHESDTEFALRYAKSGDLQNALDALLNKALPNCTAEQLEAELCRRKHAFHENYRPAPETK